MNRTEKAAAVEALEQDLAKAGNAILFGFAGLKVTEVTELRRQVRGTQLEVPGREEHAGARGAVKGTPLEAMSEHFRGADGRRVQHVATPVALAKVLTTFAKANPNLVFKGALVEGRRRRGQGDPGDRRAAEPRGAGRRSCSSSMQSPLRRLVTVLNGPVRNLAGVMHQIAEQKSKSGEAERRARQLSFSNNASRRKERRKWR